MDRMNRLEFEELINKGIYGIQRISDNDLYGCPIHIHDYNHLKEWIKVPEYKNSLMGFGEKYGKFRFNKAQERYFYLLKTGPFKELFIEGVKKDPYSFFINFKENERTFEVLKLSLWRNTYEYPIIPASIYFFSNILGLPDKTSFLLGLWYRPYFYTNLYENKYTGDVEPNEVHPGHTIYVIPKIGEKLEHFIEASKKGDYMSSRNYSKFEFINNGIEEYQKKGKLENICKLLSLEV